MDGDRPLWSVVLSIAISSFLAGGSGILMGTSRFIEGTRVNCTHVYAHRLSIQIDLHMRHDVRIFHNAMYSRIYVYNVCDAAGDRRHQCRRASIYYQTRPPLIKRRAVEVYIKGNYQA